MLSTWICPWKQYRSLHCQDVNSHSWAHLWMLLFCLSSVRGWIQTGFPLVRPDAVSQRDWALLHLSLAYCQEERLNCFCLVRYTAERKTTSKLLLPLTFLLIREFKLVPATLILSKTKKKKKKLFKMPVCKSGIGKVRTAENQDS